MSYERVPTEPLWRIPKLPTTTELEGYHVTDDPRVVAATLRAGFPLDRGMDASPLDDLKASGLYFSEYPNMWKGRSRIKWNFAERLTPEQRGAIAEAIRQDDRMTGDGYLTDYEKKLTHTWLERFTESGNVEYLCMLAEQPRNFTTWKPGFLAQFGIVNYELPHSVPVKAQGRFADVSSVAVTKTL